VTRFVGGGQEGVVRLAIGREGAERGAAAIDTLDAIGLVVPAR